MTSSLQYCPLTTMLDRCSPSVQRVVVTSSVAAVIEANKPRPYNWTEKDWNQYSIDLVEKEGRSSPVFHWYRASKSLAERAAWNFVEQNKVNFDLVTINPPYVSFRSFVLHGASSNWLIGLPSDLWPGHPRGCFCGEAERIQCTVLPELGQASAS